ncbi:MAG: GIN domain-containing protein [Paludibacteraceae bacterium]
MKETRTINLNGLVFHIDNDAYLALSDYLQDIELRLPVEEKKDVMADLEARIAELLQSALFAGNRQVVSIEMVDSLKQRVGAPSDFGEHKRPKVKRQADNQGCGRALGIALKICLIICALPVLFILFIVIFSLLMGLFGASVGLLSVAPLVGLELFGGNGWLVALSIVCLLLAVGLPIVMLVVAIVSYMRMRRGPKARFWWITVLLWILSIAGLATMAAQAVSTQGGVIPFVNMLQYYDDDMLDEENAYSMTENRVVLPFQAIELTGKAKLTLSQAPSPSVVVRSSAPEAVSTEVRDGVLYIAIDSLQNKYLSAQLEVYAPSLSAIKASGVCDLTTDDVYAADTMRLVLSGTSSADMDFRVTAFALKMSGAGEADLEVQAKNAEIDLAGAGELDLSGSAETATFRLAGAAKADAEDFVTQDMHINCSGAVKAEVNVQRSLWAQAAGVSVISYEGNPIIRQRLTLGAAKITNQ